MWLSALFVALFVVRFYFLAEETFLKIPEDKRSAKIYFLLGVTTFSSKRKMAKQYFTKSKLLDKKYYEKAKSQYNDLLKLISNKGK